MNTQQAFQKTASSTFLIGTVMFTAMKTAIFFDRATNFTAETIWIFSIAYFVVSFLMTRFEVSSYLLK